jgi:hypothetical protein
MSDSGFIVADVKGTGGCLQTYVTWAITFLLSTDGFVEHVTGRLVAQPGQCNARDYRDGDAGRAGNRKPPREHRQANDEKSK